jgi:glycosyltransferase involved in cell wall biosynthesis
MSSRRSVEILVPLFNEEASLELFVSALVAAISGLPYDFSLTLIDDGSTDSTYIKACQIKTVSTKVIQLSRNFGKEVAVQCGIDDSNADALILLDADLQDPIDLIPKFLQEWESGCDIVYGIRESRVKDSYMKRTTAGLFYKFFLKVASVKFPPHTSDARLMSRRVYLAVTQMRESQRFNKGLFHEVGFRSKGIPFIREKRKHGKTAYGPLKLLRLARDAFLGFTTRPLYWSIYIGSTIAFLSTGLALYYGFRKIFLGDAPSGYTSIIVGILFLGAIQLISLGIIGLYLAVVVKESRKRPLYFIAEKHISSSSSD